MIKKIINWIKNLFHKKEEKDPHLELYEDVPEEKIKTVCEKHLDTYKKTCPSCREAANG
jgi:hypothetical protein|tara:strand:+ start:98 stop:274 length:177 start_codon:yes stop_codon:yes gene_type:complete